MVCAVVDIHSHVVWDLDDGASTLEESLAMLDNARQGGTTDIVATPHLNAKYEYQADLTRQRAAELAEKTQGKPRIHVGCEVHLSLDNIEKVIQSPKSYTINRTQYLLVELPNVQVGKHIEAVLKHLLDEGIAPIVAHPERNPVLQRKPEMLEEWVELGCLTQLTAISVTGGFGGPAKTASAWMLQRGLAHVVASDTHDPVRRHPRLDEAYAAVCSRYGEEYAEVLFRDYPQGILDGVRLGGGKQIFDRSSSPWWQFWKRNAESA